ncbi:FAD-dependent monooxygenase [Niveispirillum sp.]|uniref:FAD-dependent monooxygenase n=1 Tax=Niveispirillum sp. TaxID=1917217 RepID=UPI001B6F2638|nr:FAD-dependent monooxygenase [Niveispirillum sp.]MBP7335972.1 FAD-dependent monooxygenase [Niveispirillum sp.]
MKPSDNNFQVVIAGAGPCGMAVAIELGLRGIRTLVCEPRSVDAYGIAKVNLVNARSMEHFRRWGIADRHRANDPVPADVARDLVFSTRANGKILFKAEGAYEWRERMPIAAETPEWAPFEAIEKSLRTRLLELDAVTFIEHSSVLDFTQDAGGVQVTYEKDDGQVTVGANYFIIANGPHSPQRRKINLRLEGRTLFHNTSWYFHAPELKTLFEKTHLCSMTFFLNDDAFGDILVPYGGDHWGYYVSPIPEGVDANDWNQVREMMFRSVGQRFETSGERGWIWGSHARMARSFNYGRAFLIGDAAHLTPPFGGFGMNMGVGDAADLGWKIAATLEGWGGPRLLDTYSLERRDVCKFIIDGSAHNNTVWGKALVREHMEEDSARGEQVRAEIRKVIVEEKTQQFRSLGAQLGYRYTGSPIIIADGTEPPPMTYGDYVPSSVPGCRAPHVWLGADDSLYDHLGWGFCLLQQDPDIDVAPLVEAAAKAGLPLKVWNLDHPGVRALYERKLTLIRPDQHVAWRGDTLPDDPGHVIDIVRGAAQYR